MPDRDDPKTDQILRREVHEDLGINVVLPERLLVLSQPQTTQPGPDIHGLLPAFVFSAKVFQSSSRWRALRAMKRHDQSADEGELMAHQRLRLIAPELTSLARPEFFGVLSIADLSLLQSNSCFAKGV
ncbi:hypothetical protein ACVIIV_004836 [Bradyrhizobium sp. USDA 4354]